MFRCHLWTAAFISALLLAGCAKDSARNGSGTDPGSATGIDDTPPKPVRAGPPPPPLAIVKGTGDLGRADYGDKRTTSFTIQNNTRKALTLQVIHKTCECAALGIKPAEVPAGETAEVTMTWVPKFQPSESQIRTDLLRAVIRAKEDSRLELTLEARGQVTPALQVSLPRGPLNFDRLELGELKTGKKELAALIYAKDPKHKGFTLEAKSSSPGIKLVPPQPTRLDPAELAQLGAADGYRLNIRCTEGLAVGSFNEVVRVKSSVYPNHELELAVEGYVDAGAVTTAPPLASVSLPEKIDLATGYKCPPITLTLNFEPGRTLTLEKVEPAFLQVTLKKVKDNVWQINVEVPAGEEAIKKGPSAAQAEEYLLTGWDRGVITFKTDHSLVPLFKLPVDASRFKR
jgi:uncharacterized protein DUF1573